MDNDQTDTASPFHSGEQQVQERLGVRGIEAWARKVVRDHLPQQHRDFHTSLPFLVVAARDRDERPWVTLLDGPEGFVTSPDDRHLSIAARPAPGNPLEGALTAGVDIGILGIELATRRRNRVNGRIVRDGGGPLTFKVGQSFGNCPQYIRERAWRRSDNPRPGRPIHGTFLTPFQVAWIEAADTFFIASGYQGDSDSAIYGMDASHRGGDRGFVQVQNETRLVFPDYAGNNHFNTIGNLVMDPRAGLLFVDFGTGSLLQMTGTASVDWAPKQLDAFPGARRLVTFDIEKIVETPAGVGLRWDTDADSVRSLRVVDKIAESAEVTSFVFEARDDGPLAPFEAGQHLPIELAIPKLKDPVSRTYSLSGAPTQNRYRISVKREPKGLVSRHLHDAIEPGAIIESRRPAGDFMLSCTHCPVVLVSAGVGVTPMVSMLHAIADEGGPRPVWFVHGARDGAHHPLASEVRRVAEAHGNINLHVAYSQPRAGDASGTDYDSEGRVTGALLADLVDRDDAHYFICGPTQFMADIQADLERRNVPLDQIHTESFGPAA